MKKLIHAVLMGMFLASVVVACGKNPEESATEITNEIHKNIDAAKDAAIATEAAANATAEQLAADANEAKEDVADAVKAAEEAVETESAKP